MKYQTTFSEPSRFAAQMEWTLANRFRVCRHLWAYVESAGQFAPDNEPMDILMPNFHHYRTKGTLDTNATVVNQASELNPTFFYSSFGPEEDGYGPAFVYQLYPMNGFHLAEYFSREGNNNIITAVQTAKTQLRAWGQSFASRINSRDSGDRCTLRFFAGDPLALCRSLSFISEGNSPDVSSPNHTSSWTYHTASFDGGDYPTNAPTAFNVIDTSNLLNHIGLLNILIACPLLLTETRYSTLYTEAVTSASSGADAIVKELFTGVDVASMLFGVIPASFVSAFTSYSNFADVTMVEALQSANLNTPDAHQRIAWKKTSLAFDKHTTPATAFRTFVEPLMPARLLVGMYRNMIRDHQKPPGSSKSTWKKANDEAGARAPHYHQDSLVALLTCARRRRLTEDWGKCIQALLEMLHSKEKGSSSQESYQELIGRLSMQGFPMDGKYIRHVPLTARRGGPLAD
ncbi:hypothetical protein BDV98DRAFT_299123 [Pterulicium gracile]|uniref:Uncharacterized protein n=1 Tax=Pterulicium gracile TaxID=1884261 RepID=A0A5C3Q4F0_9AGAR|nr:hypothetical protein BDV98DRAFT_299123 [Pterula gracilis]